MSLSDTFNSEGNLLLKMCFSLGLSDPDLWPADFNLCQVKVLYCFHVNGLDAGTDVQRKNLKTAFVPLVSPLMWIKNTKVQLSGLHVKLWQLQGTDDVDSGVGTDDGAWLWYDWLFWMQGEII